MNTQSARGTAVVQVCDANCLPFALHLFSQIVFFFPHRTFDLVLASAEALDLPAGRVSRAAYYRIRLPDQLVGRYRRILCLDNDLENPDIRFRESYAGFFRLHMPEALKKLTPTVRPQILPLERLIPEILRHIRERGVNADRFGGFRDMWAVKL